MNQRDEIIEFVSTLMKETFAMDSDTQVGFVNGFARALVLTNKANESEAEFIVNSVLFA